MKGKERGRVKKLLQTTQLQLGDIAPPKDQINPYATRVKPYRIEGIIPWLGFQEVVALPLNQQPAQV